MKITDTSYVTIDYLIRLEDGSVLPETGQPEEISFCLGYGVMPAGLEEALLGLEVNDHRVLHLSPQQGYGDPVEDYIMTVPRAEFDAHPELAPGLVFETEDEEGHPTYFLVKEVHPDTVVIDFNHPLAGQAMEIAFTVRAVRDATPDDLKHYVCSTCQEGEPHHH